VSPKGNAQIKVDQAHQKTITDIKFSNLNPNIFGTASDDNNYKLWDTRTLKD
jgi:WD40 repeat protein